MSEPKTLTTDDLQKPLGPAQLDVNGGVSAPVDGPVDNGTVGGDPLRMIIPGLAKSYRLMDGYIPARLLGQPYGPAELDGNGYLISPISPDVMGQAFIIWLKSLPTTDPKIKDAPWNNAGGAFLSLGPDV